MHNFILFFSFFTASCHKVEAKLLVAKPKRHKSKLKEIEAMQVKLVCFHEIFFWGKVLFGKSMQLPNPLLTIRYEIFFLKMFFAGSNFLSQSKNLINTSSKTFVPAHKTKG